MELVSLKVYEGNNIKGRKRIMKVTITSSFDREIKLYLKAYFRVSFLLGFTEKLIDLEIDNRQYTLWLSYTQEEISKYILRNLVFDYENIDKLTEKASGLVKEGFLIKIKNMAINTSVPVIELTETMFQLGYGKNSIILGERYQSYEQLDKIEMSRDREVLWQNLQYNHIPKVWGKVIYSINEISNEKELLFPLNIRAIDKTIDISISTQSEDEFKKVLANMMKTYTRVFVFSGTVEYRAICYKGECGLLFVKNTLYKGSEIPENIKSFCKRIYKDFPIEFMYVDLQQLEELKLVDMGCVFDLQCLIEPAQDGIAEHFISCIKRDNIGLIPIVSITGTNGKTTTARLVYYILNRLGFNTGLTSTGGVFIGDKKIKNGDTTGFLSARTVLQNKDAEAGVFETARGGIYRNGLGYENAKAAVITSLSEDHIGMQGINNLSDLADIKSVILQELCEDGKVIIKAQKELLDKAAELRKSESICLIAIRKDDLVKDHINNGGEAFFLDEQYIVYGNKQGEKKLINTKDIPFTHCGMSMGNIQNIMSAIAAVTAIYNDVNKILEVIKELKCDLDTNPGRQNILDFHNFKVILDYGHNAEAFSEVLAIARSLKPSKITSIIAAAGDRMDRYITELGEIAAKFSDKIIIREQNDLRGRAVGESANLIRKGVLAAEFNEKNLSIIYKEEDAIIKAMEDSQQNEVIVLFTQCLDVIIPTINKYLIAQGKDIIGEGIDFSH